MKWFMANSTLKKTFYVVIIVLSLITGFYFKSPSVKTKTPVAVSVVTVMLGDLTPSIDTIGSATAMNTVAIKSQVSGQLAQILVKSGQTVKQGDTLFCIDPAPFQATLNQALAIQSKDQAHATLTLEQLSRYGQLSKQGFVSKDFFSQVIANAKAAKAAVIADQATVATASLMLGYCTIRAPIAGRLGDIVPRVGDLISANDVSPMVSINQFQPIDVQFSLPAKYLTLIKSALNNHAIHVIATAHDDPYLQAQGIISFVDNQIDATTGSVIMKATFANSDTAIWPGELVQIQIQAKTLRQIILIPTIAIQQKQDGTFYVYKVDTKHTAHVQMISPGQSFQTTTAILKGLTVGEQIVTSGQFRLSDNTLVNIQ